MPDYRLTHTPTCAGGLDDGALKSVVMISSVQIVCTSGDSKVIADAVVGQLAQVEVIAIDDVGWQRDDRGAQTIGV